VLALLEKYGTAPIKNGARLSDLLKRPQLSYEALAEIDPERPDLPQDVQEQVNIQIKYAGYIDQQLKQVEQFKKLEGRLLPMELDYETIQGLPGGKTKAESGASGKSGTGLQNHRGIPCGYFCSVDLYGANEA
jgi:tRNA U34 5-carboxymethylaminomethyl modifying enzyme MnmG/GidA